MTFTFLTHVRNVVIALALVGTALSGYLGSVDAWAQQDDRFAGQPKITAGKATEAASDGIVRAGGAKIYRAHCISCHGTLGDGKTSGPVSPDKVIPDFTAPAAVTQLTRKRVLMSIREGHAGLSVAKWRGQISEEEQEAVVSYVHEAFILPTAIGDPSLGKNVYARNCSVCHGEHGNSASWAKNSLNPSPFDFTSFKAKKLSRRHMINIVSYGKDGTAMVGWATRLSRKEVVIVVDYIRANFIFPGDAKFQNSGIRSSEILNFKNPAARGGPSDMTRPLPDGLVGNFDQGKKLFSDNCAPCHGSGGGGDGRRAYFIFPRPENFLGKRAKNELNRPQLFTSISSGLVGTVMPAWETVLKRQQIADVAEYVFSAFVMADVDAKSALDAPSKLKTGPSTVGAEPKKKLTVPAPKTDTPAIKRGQRLYNGRCYFCHGYGGDAQTEAAKVLSPPPRDFTRAVNLDGNRILTALHQGRPGTAMKSFSGILSQPDMRDIAAFIINAFVAKKATNILYHTKSNGWTDHRQRYAAAYPFVMGKMPTAPSVALTADEREGLDLFKSACIVCHEGKSPDKTSSPWDKYPLSGQGCGVVCHADDSVSFPWKTDAAEHTTRLSPATPYEAHGRPPDAVALSPLETVGRVLYERNCAFCHAMDGTGGNWIGSFLEPHARDLTDPKVAATLTEARLFEVIRQGIPGTAMSAWRTVLDANQMASVVAYVQRVFLDPANKRMSPTPMAEAAP